MKLHKLLLSLLFVVFASMAVAQSSLQLKRQKEAIQREIDLLQRNLNKTASSKQLTLGQIRALNTKIKLMQNKITVINSEMKALDGEIHQNTNTIRSLKKQLDELKDDYAGMVRFAQRNRNAYDKMMFIFASKDFNQAYKRIKYLQQFGQYRKKQADYIQGTQRTLNNKISVLDKSLKEKSNLLKEQENERNKLGKNKNEQSAVLSKFSKQEREYKQDISNRKKNQAAIERAIRAAINREIAEARRKAEEEARLAAEKAKADNKPAPAAVKPGGNYLNATPEAAKLSASFESNRGRLPWPVDAGSITENFGQHKEGQASYRNDGVNIMTNDNAQVRAIFNGKVFFVINIQGVTVVTLSHGEYFSIYQNLKGVTVSKGDIVTTKQVLGTIATTADGPMLHFEIMRNLTKLNPEAWIAK